MHHKSCTDSQAFIHSDVLNMNGLVFRLWLLRVCKLITRRQTAMLRCQRLYLHDINAVMVWLLHMGGMRHAGVARVHSCVAGMRVGCCLCGRVGVGVCCCVAIDALAATKMTTSAHTLYIVNDWISSVRTGISNYVAGVTPACLRTCVCKINEDMG